MALITQSIIKKSGTSPKSEQPFTARGRALDQKFFKGSKKNPKPSAPVFGRNRSNSLRRLTAPRLAELAESHKNENVRAGATRELEVRAELIDTSKKQQKTGAMASNRAIGLREASAMRFAASLAEEAQDEIHNEASGSGKKSKLGQIGIANVKGSLGLGFSGRKSQVPFINKVKQRMLALQAHYRQARSTGDWSARLTPVVGPTVTGEGNVCAASRAKAAALAGHGPSLFSKRKTVDRSVLPTPDSLVEMTSRATHPTGGRLKKFEAQPLDTDQYARGYQGKTMATRNRNGSVSNMANSCKTCIEERDHARSGASSSTSSESKQQ